MDTTYRPWDALINEGSVLGVLSVNRTMARGVAGSDVVHAGVFWIRQRWAEVRPSAEPRHRLRVPLPVRVLRAGQRGRRGVRGTGGGDRDRWYPEIAVDGVTGYLVPLPSVDNSGSVEEPARLAQDLAARINDLVSEPGSAHCMGLAGRDRVQAEFGWLAIAAKTVSHYRIVLGWRA